MNKYKSIISIIVIAISILACKPKEMINYESVDGVWFSIQPPTNTAFGNPDHWPAVDTTQAALIKLGPDVKDTVVNLLVRVMGEVKDYDRKFGIRSAATSTAESGVDFDPIPEYITVPAGAVRAYVPVKINRLEKMKLAEFFLTLELVATDDFTVPFPKRILPPLGQHGNEPDDSIFVNKHTLIISDMIYTPQTWNEFVGGKFTYKKMELIYDMYGVTFSDLDNPATMNVFILRPILEGIKYYLEEQEELGNPIYEVDALGNVIYHVNEETGEFILDEEGEKIPVLVKFGNV